MKSEHNRKDAVYLSTSYGPLIGGPALQAVIQQVQQVADTDATVLLTGETGTGKEVIAQAIHEWSARSTRPMVKVNCAALPPQLIESELFGHEKGAFTGALQRRAGKFELAHQSTIFLDEIGELPLEQQPKLLRVIQEKEVERIGGSTVKTDVRVVAATNRILEAECQSGRFRYDLYYRLNVFPIHLPPLRERKEDIPLLAKYFVENASQHFRKPVAAISQRSMEAMLRYDWPGNIRELQHLVERAVIIGSAPVIYVELPPPEKARAAGSSPPITSLAEAERQLIIRVLKHCNGRVRGENGAAAILQIKPTTLEARMKKLGITRQHTKDN
ncbi:sigma-54-dependent Fis family transcriptional regulator [Chitinophaga oryzae]|uniref:Sigma-54-dependent Fis family transcriptional regulator n=1 Tax=Chitinophaga oryzae TaxID=2725414 RepID=A0AAE6ZHF2_9BACT|nr:sigma-54 dependent transcriptional regulator [Chitinophaga oryzae]QJB32257.1 sigma-54-dependent Fis family transcriptional regulator [Chitinophaga oryzae]QJB38718.1 sigma-54-dependent Fis family transcriptional regulator [Chitinophaga oryzae]